MVHGDTVISRRCTITEQEWATCTDPRRMLTKVIRRGVPRRESEPGGSSDWASERKLRLYAVACCRLIWHLLEDRASRNLVTLAERQADEPVAEGKLYDAWNAANESSYSSLTHWVLPMLDNSLHDCVVEHLNILKVVAGKDYSSAQAHIMRDIIGNPFQPSVVLPRDVGNVLDRLKRRDLPQHRQGNVIIEEWLTPQVLSLAQAAYEERGKVCNKCNGDGWEGYPADEDEYACARCGRAAGVYGHYSERSKKMECPKCPTCDGSGQTSDGTLDPVRLAILADAIEESGASCSVCDECVDGDVGCSYCEGAGIYYDPPESLNRLKCPHCIDGLLQERCKKCGGTGRLPHPILTHLRSHGPHYRGCHVLDLILSKEKIPCVS